MSWPRLITLLLLLAAGGFMGARPYNSCGWFSYWYEAASAIGTNAVAFLLLTAFIATVVFLVRRLVKGRGTRWLLLDWVVLLISGVLIVLGSLGAAARRAEQCRNAHVVTHLAPS